MAESSCRAPISLPTYALGDKGKDEHFDESVTREAAAAEAQSLEVGDAAFILRSDRQWAYSILTEKTKGEGGTGDSYTLTFELDEDVNVKRFPENVWGKYIRVIKVDEAELAKLKAEEAAKQIQEEAPKEENDAPKEESKPEGVEEEEAKKEDAETAEGNAGDADEKDEKTQPFMGSMNEFGSMVSGFFGSVSKKIEETKAEVAKKVAGEMGTKAVEKKEEEAGESGTEKNAENTEESKPATVTATAETKDEPGASSPVPDAKVSAAAAALSGGVSWLSSLNLFEKKPDEAKPAVDAKDEAREPTESTSAAEDAEESTPPEPAPEPIKLLQTPIAFYKAPSMKEDPAAAAIANTSFADKKAYRTMMNSGVVIVENDPSAVVTAEAFERERHGYGQMEAQGVTIIETNCSVDTEKGAE